MTTLFVRHQVSDFAQWKQAYDDFDAKRQKLGVSGQAVYQAADDPNNVTVTHDFPSLEAAQQFAGSDELRSAMERAGVAGEPALWFTEQA